MAYGKKWVPTPKILEQIKELATKGVTEASIARIVGISPTGFSAKKKEYPEIEEVIRQAHASGEDEVVGYLWDILRDNKHKNHFAAIQFYLKSKHSWGDNGTQEEKPGLPTGVNFQPAPPKGNES